MREIKFRAWDKEDKTMEYDLVLSGMKNLLEHRLMNPKMFEVMQFTGLKDKNGVEIYEGDMVSDEKGSGVVIWNESIASFSVKEGEHQFFSLNAGDIGRSLQLMGTEVIGNIYQNPELLK